MTSTTSNPPSYPVTLVSAPKPFTERSRTAQENALRSWLRILPGENVILVGPDSGIEHAARDHGTQYIGGIERNEWGTPLISSIFSAAEIRARTPLLAYVNADIILTADFLPAVRSVPFDRFLMVGRRWNLDPAEVGDVDELEWETKLRSAVSHRGSLDQKDAIDYFVFSRGLWPSIPPFALGRTAWDNWLVYAAVRSGAEVIDATDSILAVHQIHDYSHHPGGTQAVWHGPESQRNLQLAGGRDNLFVSTDANWVLTNGVLRSPPLSRRVYSFLFTGASAYPRWAPFFRAAFHIAHQCVSSAKLVSRRSIGRGCPPSK